MSNKTMEKPNWLNVLKDEKIEVEPFEKTKEETKGEPLNTMPEIWHYAETRNWRDSNKPELSNPFQFRMRKDLEELIKEHTKGSKNQVINDILEIGLKHLEEEFKKLRG